MEGASTVKPPSPGAISLLRGIQGVTPESRQKTLGPVTRVPVRSLSTDHTVRASGECTEHTRAVSAVLTELPPIIVHRTSMHVIDGLHRLRAAELREWEFIAAHLVDGEEIDTLILAVQTNLTGIRPLSPPDRKTAAARIISLRPDWSDRAIGSITDLSTKTVREVRRAQSTVAPSVPAERVGRDGRVRPVNPAERRRKAAELIRNAPDMPLRQIAKAVGISPETARSVRNQVLGSGTAPAVRGPTVRRPAAREPAGPPPGAGIDAPDPGLPPTSRRGTALQRLTADPSLRYSETGRILLRMLKVHSITEEQWEAIIKGLPAHRRQLIANAALECARGWTRVAAELARNTS
ncbi:ParB N-terminal domain-containing protein [Streptomyces sp. NPDC091217]|uniref:ParB N-terminal domain-containing protein n=1 Tax=Streptomyces sp. NPDC091217 TaxID=3365975 RepID=UPI00381BA76F